MKTNQRKYDRGLNTVLEIATNTDTYMHIHMHKQIHAFTQRD